MVKEFYITIQGGKGEEGQWNNPTERETEKHTEGGRKGFNRKGSEGWEEYCPTKMQLVCY